MAGTRNRPMQDFVTWPAYGTRAFWQNISECPELATELCCHYLTSLGAVNPSEPTCREVAAHATVAMHGRRCMAVTVDEVNRIYDDVKASACMVCCATPAVTTASCTPCAVTTVFDLLFVYPLRGDNRFFYLT